MELEALASRKFTKYRAYVRLHQKLRGCAGLAECAETAGELVDNYIDETVLFILGKRKAGVEACIYTPKVTTRLQIDLDKYNSQYPPIAIHTYKNSHDRFLILDHQDVYHIGASLKDLGKKLFAFSKLNESATAILQLITDNP